MGHKAMNGEQLLRIANIVDPPTVKLYDRVCQLVACAKAFKSKSPVAKYCSNKCTKQAYWGVTLNLCSGRIGAMNELIAAADLISKGYEVFRSVSPASSCDLIILKEGRTQLVKVRTGQRHSRTGKIRLMHPKHRADILAVVIAKEVFYFPALEPGASTEKVEGQPFAS
jgi:hypothetical protein